ncbi:MAG: hypothetical protein HOP29_09835 [Phycisphaerales bacterium]|nr:hypothetical protein [Phycisphaerales bacterium]
MKTVERDPKQFFERPEAVALVVDPAAVFGLLNRSLRLPGDQVALIRGELGDRRVCLPGGTVSADDVSGLLLVRIKPVDVRLDEVTVSSADHFPCEASVGFRVVPVGETGELSSFEQRIMGRQTGVDVAGVSERFEDAVRAGLAAAAEGRGVEALIEPRRRDEVIADVAGPLRAAAFAAGVRIEGSIEVRIDSPLYRQSVRARAESKRLRDEFVTRERLAEARESAQRRRAEHLTGLLDRLRNETERSPGLELSELLRSFADTDRAELYGAVLGTCHGRSQTKWVVVGSGDEILHFDPRSMGEAAKRRTIGAGIGPIRSVQSQVDAAGFRRLFVGAATGVHELGSEGDGDVRTYRAAVCGSVRGGFNAVALVGDVILATHSELGLMRWRRDSDARGAETRPEEARGVATVRGVQVRHGDVFYAVDEEVRRIRADDLEGESTRYTGSGAPITSFTAVEDGVYAGNANGEVLHWPVGTPDRPSLIVQSCRRAIESIVFQEFPGLRRLLYTDASAGVSAKVLDDRLTCRYEAGGQTVLRVEVAYDLIAGTTEMRDRLICWLPGEPGKPHSVAAVGRVTHHSIQDVCLIPGV